MKSLQTLSCVVVFSLTFSTAQTSAKNVYYTDDLKLRVDGAEPTEAYKIYERDRNISVHEAMLRDGEYYQASKYDKMIDNIGLNKEKSWLRYGWNTFKNQFTRDKGVKLARQKRIAQQYGSEKQVEKASSDYNRYIMENASGKDFAKILKDQKVEVEKYKHEEQDYDSDSQKYWDDGDEDLEV